MIVLGFTFWKGSHDSSAAIVRDGSLVAAAEEERFSRVKHDGSVPLAAIDFCFHAAGVTMRDVDVIAYPDRPFRTGRNSQIAEMKSETLAAMVETGHARKRSLLHKKALDIGLRIGIAPDAGMNPMVAEGFRAVEERYGTLPRMRYYGHHLAHAAAAYLTSGFEEAAVVTIDGRGGPLSAATWHGRSSALECLDEEPYTNSLGWFYRDCTRFAGLGDFGEGKLMGLAPYGRPSAQLATVNSLLDTTDPRWFRYRAAPNEELAGFPARHDEDVLSGPYADFGAGVQHALERGYERAVRSAAGTSGSRNLCVGGGVAMNCSANGKLLAASVADDMWLFPASGDAGLSVGAALLASRDAGERVTQRIESPYWGPEFDDAAIESALQSETRVKYCRPASLSAHVASAIAAGSVAGWFQGRMELGPRALGNRSILADPRTIEMRDKVNRVKGRELWRPLAPSILADRTHEYFERVPPNAFMLFATQARAITKEVAPAIVHVDGSARPQPVSRDLNPRFHDLLEAFDELTGVPILLNTSFNAAGEPIVCTPADALRTFVSTNLDILVMGSFVATRSA
ncbi:MAG: carbamoyltransferase C-terminal domain-containing protein [Gemmatimonadales bacterium]